MVSHGLIEKAVYQPESFSMFDGIKKAYIKRTHLKTKVKVENKIATILKPAVYTADWLIDFSEKFKLAGVHDIESTGDETWCNNKPLFIVSSGINGRWVVDVKGGHVGRGHGDGRYFSFMQKMMYEKHDILPQKVEITNGKNGWFDKTFTPKRFLKTDKSGKARTLKYEPRSIEEFKRKYLLDII